MKNNLLSLVAIILPTVSLFLVIKANRDLEPKERWTVEAREVKEATEPINKTRASINLPPVSPQTHREARNALLESLAKMVNGMAGA